jgi:hypothetical protein
MFADDCHGVESAGCGPEDLVVVPYATDVELLGLAQWAERLAAAGSALPFLAAIIHRPDFAWTWDAAKHALVGDPSFLGYACERLARAAGPQGHVVLTTTEMLARALNQMAGVGAVPGCASAYYDVLDDALPRTLPSPSGGGRFDVAVLGQTRPEKGSTILAAIVRTYLARRPEARLAIQLSNHAATARIDNRAEIADDPRITWHVGSLDSATYAGTMAAAGSVLIPFVPERYIMRISGIFSDALALGRPVVVPPGTWMERMLVAGYGAGVVAEEPSVEGYTLALERVGLDGDRIGTLARDRAAAWRRDQSLDRLVRLLLDEAAARRGAGR